MTTRNAAGALCLLSFLQCVALLVPGPLRAEWLAEWNGELAHVWRVRRRGPWFAIDAPLVFCMGAIRDALWFLRNRQSAIYTCFKAPLRCLSLLTALAGLSWIASLFVVSMHGVAHSELYAGTGDQSIESYLVEVAVALMILPATTSLSMGEYPRRVRAGRRQFRWRPPAFFLAKVGMVLMLAYFAGKCLMHLCVSIAVMERWPLLASAIRECMVPIQPFASCLACLYGMRWALRDQRQRCPSCLHLLSSPARVGAPSRSFLSWNGTELICRGGHGLLHVPEMQTSWLATQRWQDLDASWQLLFRE